MNKKIKKQIADLASTDDKIRMDALQGLLQVTESKVDWGYEVWDSLLEKLRSENSYQRSIGVMLLCNLAKSDEENRLGGILDRLLIHTRDEKFITSRQCLQNIWKVAATNKPNRDKVMKHLEKRFVECTIEKHYNLLRQDILQSMLSLSLYREEEHDSLLASAQALIAKEQDQKYRKQYETLLKAQ